MAPFTKGEPAGALPCHHFDRTGRLQFAVTVQCREALTPRCTRATQSRMRRVAVNDAPLGRTTAVARKRSDRANRRRTWNGDRYALSDSPLPGIRRKHGVTGRIDH
jgi:hypothetical protein